MVDKITGQMGINPVVKQKAAYRAYNQGQVAGGSDEASISPFAKELGRIMGELNSVSDVRTDRIEDFKKQVAEGAYNPDPAKVARSLVIAGLLNGEE